MSLFKRKNAIPRPGPAGGVFHVIPMSGGEVKKLARGMVKIDYVRDKSSKMIFVDNGKGKQPIPMFDSDEDFVTTEALKRCPQIDEVTEEEFDDKGNVIGEKMVVDPMAAAKGLPDGTIIDKEIIAAILDTLVTIESEVDVPPEAAAVDHSEAADHIAARIEDGVDPSDIIHVTVTPPAKKKKVSTTLTHSEWLLGEAAELGSAKVVAEAKNS